MRALAHPLPEQLTLPALLHALSDPVRLQIVRALRDGVERPCGQLEVAVSKSTLSHHLRVLRDAGLTHTRADGVQRFVSLRRDDVDARFPGLLSCVLKQERGRPQAAARPAREPSVAPQSPHPVALRSQSSRSASERA
ncbi:MAG: ArsR/SmtB family transcription factor [Solirubrobacteraceae bacterium]